VVAYIKDPFKEPYYAPMGLRRASLDNMKKAILITAYLMSGTLIAERYLVDKIDAVVMGYQNTDVFVELIMRSDSDRPNLLGQMVSQEQLVKDACYYIDARRLHAVMLEDQIEIVWNNLLHAYNLTREGLVNVVQGLGYSEEEARKQLGRINTINQLIDMRVTGNIVIEKAEIEAYYEAHPAYHDGMYTLQRAIIPFESDQDTQEQELKSQIATHADGLTATWSQSFTVGFSEVAKSKASIHTAQAGDVVFTGKTNEGFELYKLVARKEPVLKTLVEQYDEIVDALRQPQAEKMLAAYQESLEKKLVIEYV
jgi:hypothetical protein